MDGGCGNGLQLCQRCVLQPAAAAVQAAAFCAARHSDHLELKHVVGCTVAGQVLGRAGSICKKKAHLVYLKCYKTFSFML